MKKLMLVLSLVVVMMTNLMAEPFSDVPFSHWAYDAISKLAAKGIVTGFPDGTFRGAGKMTRYEIALILARMLDEVQKGSVVVRDERAPQTVNRPSMNSSDMEVIQKLTIEFADELALLGVKVHALEDDLAMIKDRINTVQADLVEVKALAQKKEEGSVLVSGKYTMDHHLALAGDNSFHAFQNKLRLYTNISITKGINAYVRNDVKQTLGAYNTFSVDNVEALIRMNIERNGKDYGKLKLGRFVHVMDDGLAYANYTNGILYNISTKSTNFGFTSFDLGWDIEVLLAKDDNGAVGAGALAAAGDKSNFFETKIFKFKPHTNWALANMDFFFAMRSNAVAKGFEPAAGYTEADAQSWIGLNFDFRFKKGDAADRQTYRFGFVNSTKTAGDDGGMAMMFNWNLVMGEKRDRNLNFAFINYGEDFAPINHYAGETSPFDSFFAGKLGRLTVAPEVVAGKANSLVALVYNQKWAEKHNFKFELNMQTEGDKGRVIGITDTYKYANKVDLSYGIFNYGCDAGTSKAPWLNAAAGTESETMFATQLNVRF
jgi:hypothetical protein